MKMLDSRTARRLWPPLTQWQIVVGIALIVFIITEATLAPDDLVARPPLGSMEYYTDALAITLILGQVLLVALTPLLGFTLVAALGLVFSFVPEFSTLGLLWLVPAVLASIPLGQAARARVNVGTPAPRRLPVRGYHRDMHVYRSPRLGYIVLGCLPLVAVGLLVFHQVEVADISHFESRAVSATATVVSEPDDDGVMTVSLDGTEHTLDSWELAEDPAPGDEIAVLTDPDAPERIVAVEALEDPSWLLFIALLLIAVMPFPYRRWIRPARQRARLVAVGGPARAARLLELPSGSVFLLPRESWWPVVRLRGLAGFVPAHEVEEFFEGDPDDEYDSDDEYDPDDGYDDDEDELPETAEDLQALLRDGTLTDDDRRLLQLALGPDAPRPIDVTVIGTPHLGSTVGVVHADDAWLGEVSMSTWRPGLRARIRKAADGSPGQGPWSSLVTFHPQLLRVLWGVLSVVVAVGVVAITSWDDPGEWLRAVVIIVLWAGSGFGYGVGDGGLSLSEGRLLLLGSLRDEIITPSRVRLMVADQQMVALRLEDPDEVAVVDAASIVGRFDATGAEALERLELWRSLGDGSSRPGRRLSYLTWGAIATLVAGLATAALWLG